MNSIPPLREVQDTEVFYKSYSWQVDGNRSLPMTQFNYHAVTGPSSSPSKIIDQKKTHQRIRERLLDTKLAPKWIGKEVYISMGSFNINADIVGMEVKYKPYEKDHNLAFDINMDLNHENIKSVILFTMFIPSEILVCRKNFSFNGHPITTISNIEFEI